MFTYKQGSPRLLFSSFSLLRIFEKLGIESQLFRRTQKAESEKLAFLGGSAKHVLQSGSWIPTDTISLIPDVFATARTVSPGHFVKIKMLLSFYSEMCMYNLQGLSPGRGRMCSKRSRFKIIFTFIFLNR